MARELVPFKWIINLPFGYRICFACLDFFLKSLRMNRW